MRLITGAVAADPTSNAAGGAGVFGGTTSPTGCMGAVARRRLRLLRFEFSWGGGNAEDLRSFVRMGAVGLVGLDGGERGGALLEFSLVRSITDPFRLRGRTLLEILVIVSVKKL